MKKRKGYISILALIVMTASTIMILRIIFLNSQQNNMSKSRENNIQSYYFAEDKILMSLYLEKYSDDQLYTILTSFFRKRRFNENDLEKKLKSIMIDEFDLEDSDNKAEVKLTIENKENIKELVLKSQSDYKGIKTSVKARTNLVNELFEIKEPILSMENIHNNYKEDLEKLLRNIEENISVKDINDFDDLYAAEISEYNEISLKNINGKKYNLFCTRDTMVAPFIEVFEKSIVFILIKNCKKEKSTFQIDCSEKDIGLSGIIYVEGDIEISSGFSFNGIIIVKDGKIKINKIENKADPIVRGMIILYDNENGLENICVIEDKIIEGKVIEDKIENEIKLNLAYSDFAVYRYGNLLPGFFDIKLKSIKNGG